MEFVPEDWERGLAVAAHPDDLEYGASSAIAKWTSQGKDIRYAMVTSGEAGIQGMSPKETGPLREHEQIEAANLVGVSQVEFMGFADGQLEANLKLRTALAELIRKHQPEVIISLNFRENFGAGWNHADHRALGTAILDAARDAANPWAFTKELKEKAWDKARFCVFAASPKAEHTVDVTDFFELGLKSLFAHQTYLKTLGETDEKIREMLEPLSKMWGQEAGVGYAQNFELIQL